MVGGTRSSTHKQQPSRAQREAEEQDASARAAGASPEPASARRGRAPSAQPQFPSLPHPGAPVRRSPGGLGRPDGERVPDSFCGPHDMELQQARGLPSSRQHSHVPSSTPPGSVQPAVNTHPVNVQPSVTDTVSAAPASLAGALSAAILLPPSSFNKFFELPHGRIQSMVGSGIGRLLQTRGSLRMESAEAKEFLASTDDMAAVIAVHDPTRQQYDAFWVYNPKLDNKFGSREGGWNLFKKTRSNRLGTLSSVAWGAYLSAQQVTHLIPVKPPGQKNHTEAAMVPLKTWCQQILGPNQQSTAYRALQDPFGHTAIRAAVAAAWGGQIDPLTRAPVQMPTITFEQLAFAVDAVYAHLLNPFSEGQRGKDRNPRITKTMDNLEQEVAAFGGWHKVESVKVVDKNVDPVDEAVQAASDAVAAGVSGAEGPVY